MVKKAEKTKKQNSILIVDDELEMLKLLDRFLQEAGYKVLKAMRASEAIKIAKEEEVDLIILDVDMPGMDGMEAKKKLSSDTSTSTIPVIFLTGNDEPQDKVKGFSLGVDDYITKPFNLEELLARITAVLERRKFYEEISMTDGLTGLPNIHYFKKQFTLFFNIAKRRKEVFSLAIVDVNKFKEINDLNSHVVGDFVLKKLASLMKEHIRATEIITRYGGDEFAIIFPGARKKEAQEAMERVRDQIKGKTFTCTETGKKISFSISIGIASYQDKFTSESQLFEAADSAMYKDKNPARNK